MKKSVLFFLILSIFLNSQSCSRFKKQSVLDEEKKKQEMEKSTQEKTIKFKDSREAAIYKAKKLYQEKSKKDANFNKGPCLSNEIYENWVADIAHNPREPIDNLAENQCAAYLKKTARHIVELDPNGNLIRAY